VTQAAVALRLLSLDAAVRYGNDAPPWRQALPSYHYVQLPALTPDHSKVHAVSGIALTGAADSFVPQLLDKILPPDPIDFELDVEVLAKQDDDAHLCHSVPTGARHYCIVAERPAWPMLESLV
jgi:hypothetical protein